jgi:hypothetical protein
VDTAYFTGNYSPKVSIYGANLSSSSMELASGEDDIRGRSSNRNNARIEILNQLVSLRQQSIINRNDEGEHSRIGLELFVFYYFHPLNVMSFITSCYCLFFHLILSFIACLH